MKVLLIDGGGRGHALGWKLAQSPHVKELHFAPGNAGMAQLGMCHTVAPTDLEGLVALTQHLKPDLVVVGPDDPLALGLVDNIMAMTIPVFGPTRAGAQIEASKSFAKSVMGQANIPTARYATFSDPKEAKEYIKSQQNPVVVKADGLALGKGVIVCDTPEQALEAVDHLMINEAFGLAGRTVVIEEKLDGPEFSILCLTDGEHTITFPAIQDHKRIGEGDTGPNTGGMGTYHPVPFYNRQLEEQVISTIINPLLRHMRELGTPFKGCLYPGLMLTPEGPKVIEFNARFGDPETQVAMAMLDEDLFELFEGSAAGYLITRQPNWRNEACVCVVAASKGYPGDYEKGKPIEGLKEAEATGALIFHAGTTHNNNQIVTSGGRVLNIVGRGPDIKSAQAQAYRALDKIHFDGIYFRKDIAWRALS